ncbi:hypothetical protein C8J57DRAFT_1407209 [Mycena rebaudengoi]|nr:hypothetical protein C8J57DRAFT_1407209 [Mycena rebaudengoi]
MLSPAIISPIARHAALVLLRCSRPPPVLSLRPPGPPSLPHNPASVPSEPIINDSSSPSTWSLILRYSPLLTDIRRGFIQTSSRFLLIPLTTYMHNYAIFSSATGTGEYSYLAFGTPQSTPLFPKSASPATPEDYCASLHCRHRFLIGNVPFTLRNVLPRRPSN